MDKIKHLENEIKNLKATINMRDDEVMTLAEVARFLKIGESNAYQMAKKGELPMTRKAGAYRILKSKLLRWINE